MKTYQVNVLNRLYTASSWSHFDYIQAETATEAERIAANRVEFGSPNNFHATEVEYRAFGGGNPHTLDGWYPVNPQREPAVALRTNEL